MYKAPAFGQPAATSSFSSFTPNANTNLFGQQTVFGKTASPGFGTQSAFGATPTAGLFGSQMPASNSLFGASATTSSFGQTQPTQSGFGFATTAQPATNLFGAQPTTGTGLFGTSQASAFGQNKPAFGTGFGATPSTGLFGTQPTTAAPLFGATTTGTAQPFGNSGAAFGASVQTSGTVIKFNPITSTDTLQKGNSSQQINVRHFCITCMKEYENKSLEELRFEDYAANRKGPQQTTGLFGQTPTQPSLFGANSGTSGLFGAQPPENKTLFGTNTTLGGFGNTTTGVFGTQPQATTSLFGAKPTGFGTTTTTSATGFGFGQPATTNLFGSTQNTFGGTTTPSLFGQPATQPSATGFGATTGFTNFATTQPNQSIGLFGAQNKPATTTFSLGTPATSSGFSFGQTSTANTGIFGAKPATTGFGTGFGATGNTFGATNTSSSLFNKPATPAFNFAGTTPGFGSVGLNTGTSAFSSTQAKPGGLFGTSTTGSGLFSSNSQFGAGGNTFGSSTTGLGGTPLNSSFNFGGPVAPAAPPVAAPAHSAILALASLPFADSPLYKNLLPAVAKCESQLKPTNAITQKAILASKDLKISPKVDSRVKLKSLATIKTKHSLFEGLEDSSSPTPSLGTTGVKTLSLKPKSFNQSSLTETMPDSVGNKENRRVSFSLPLETPRSGEKDPDNFYIRRNPLFVSSGGSQRSTLDDIQPAASSTIVESPSKDVTPSMEDVISDSRTSTSIGDTRSPDTSKNMSNLDETQGFLNESSKIDEDWVPHRTGITLRRLDYYIIPSLDELEDLVTDDGSCIVENFCIGRRGYGNIYYDETMDVSGLNIDEIVHFRHKEIIVYPDESVKPPVGEQLNRKCQVTLEQVWPVDKTTREPIRDVELLQTLSFENKLRRCTTKMKAHFMEYRPITGSWVFRVDHFSKYGLSDSEDEEDIPMGVKPKGPVVSKAFQPATPLQVPPGKTTASTVLSPILPPKQPCYIIPDGSGTTFTVPNSGKDKPMQVQDISYDVDLEDVDDPAAMEDSIMDSPWSPSAARVDHHRVQLMKSSLFHSQIQEEEFNDLGSFQEFGNYRGSPQNLQRSFQATQTNNDFAVSMTQFKGVDDSRAAEYHVRSHVMPPLNPRPNSVSVKRSCSVIPYEKSTIGRIGNRYISDMGLSMGRRFRPGWGRSSQMTCLATRKQAARLGITLSSRAESDFSHTLIQRLSIYPTESREFKDSIEKHLMVQLEHSSIENHGGCPISIPLPGVPALHKHCLLATEYDNPSDKWLTYCRQVWQLCGALWGSLQALSQQDDPSSHQSMMMRKEALTEWLRSCTEPLLKDAMETKMDVTSVLASLTCYNVAKACETSQAKGEHYTSLLMCSGQTGKSLLQDQLKEWTNVAADKYIDKKRLQLYTVASGLPILQTSGDLLNACKDLDWRCVFGLHFWYACSPVHSIPEVLTKYKEAFAGRNVYADHPHPPYSDNVVTSSGQVILDLCYHLIELFCSRAYPLEPLLNPATHTADPLDYRLSWLLEQVLSSLGYHHVSNLSSAITCMSFSSQLEAHGLWHWSVFACLHLKDDFSRKQAVLDIINRHVSLLDDEEFSMEEAFIVDELKVPQEWVYYAKATRSLASFSYDDATQYLILAQEWNRAHETIIRHIAPDMVINDNFPQLEDLLKRIEPYASEVAEWPQQGQLLLDYIDIRRTVHHALDEHDTRHLEERLPHIASVCNRVIRWPTPTIKHSLCRAEIAKGTAHIYVIVKQLDNSESGMRDARALISKLQLPEDYFMEEMEIIKKNEAAVDS